MYKEDLALNNLQGLICRKTQPNQFIDVQLISLISQYLKSFNCVQKNEDRLIYKICL